jgi:hypothetical protein
MPPRPTVAEGPITLYDRKGYSTTWPARDPGDWTPRLAGALAVHVEALAADRQAEAQLREAMAAEREAPRRYRQMIAAGESPPASYERDVADATSAARARRDVCRARVIATSAEVTAALEAERDELIERDRPRVEAADANVLAARAYLDDALAERHRAILTLMVDRHHPEPVADAEPPHILDERYARGEHEQADRAYLARALQVEAAELAEPEPVA